jgi:DNA repair protein RadC
VTRAIPNAVGSGQTRPTMVGQFDWMAALVGARAGGPEDLGDRLIDVLGRLEQEAVLALIVSPAGIITGVHLVALGTCFRAAAEPRDVFREAVSAGAAAVIIAHNHPSGSTAPTQADLALTTRMIVAGRILGIEVLDHLVVGDRSWRSLRESTAMWQEADATAFCGCTNGSAGC